MQTQRVTINRDEIEVPGPFGTTHDVVVMNESNGYHWFDDDTMAFFNSRLESGLILGRFFIESGQVPKFEGGLYPRTYTVRCALDDGRIHHIGDLELATYGAAMAALDEFLAD